ncbi:type VI secretion system-associated FHA domain protein TagH [Erythrobacter sp. GH1-10]|uniref:type VI secretion system-associated FHA domain protein TagH n=1 Tax=Erythrobacter sp. GH1-10 TaxID=3349334 RepID=UPI00387807D0
MTLTLKIVNKSQLENGSSTELVLNNRGAKIGRSMSCQWILPDDTRTLSGTHCEVQFRHDDYYLVDEGSTNGTFLGNSEDRLDRAHKIAPGDRFRIGPYVVEARLSGSALHKFENERQQEEDSKRQPGFSDWDDVPGGRPPAAASQPQGFEDDGGWDLPGAAPDRSSNWSEEVSRSSTDPTADDVFGDFTAKNQVDWTSAAWTVDEGFDPFATDADESEGFAPIGDQPQDSDLPAEFSEPSSDPFGGPLDSGTDDAWPEAPPASEPSPTPGGDPFGSLDGSSAPEPAPAPPASAPTEFPSPSPTPAPAPAPAPAAPSSPAPAPASPDAVYAALLGALGVPSNQVTIPPGEASAKAGRMLRHLLAGLMILLEARARAKEEMGATGTSLGFDGNNPLKFARNVDQALQMMLNPKMTGYMEAETAIEEAYHDLQAHQIATLKAMQGALRETLNRFSPAAIKARTKEQGLLAKVMRGQREAALWKAYESQFSGVAEGSAEAFLEVFSKEFRRAYEEASR